MTVLLERRIISRSFWSMPSWYLHTVALGRHLTPGDAIPSAAKAESSTANPGIKSAGKTDSGELFAWSGYQVHLYKDACERYWHALIGRQPLVYVVCRDRPHDDAQDSTAVSIEPAFVTIDYDEAVAAVETDALVLSAPIPVELYRFMEDFVLQHYKPKTLKKRKRRNWTDEHGAQPNTADKRGTRHE